MSIRPFSDSTIYRFPHAFISKKGEPIVVTLLDVPAYYAARLRQVTGS